LDFIKPLEKWEGCHLSSPNRTPGKLKTMLHNAEKTLSAPFYAIKIRSEGLMGEAESFFGNFLARFKLKTL
jgi:hypothetical protein